MNLPADLPEALQPPERFTTTSEVAGSLPPSPEVNKSILVEESDQGGKGRREVRPKGNHQRPGWLYDFET